MQRILLSGLIYGALISVLALHGGLAGSAHAASTSGQEATDSKKVELMERYFRGVRMALQELPRDRFAVASVAQPLQGDPAKSLAWVCDHTDWVPYTGILRGPKGVLMDRVGNDWDRSLLLAALLEAGGLEVRLAQATWTKDALSQFADRIDAATALPEESYEPWDIEEFARRMRIPSKALKASGRSVRWRQEQAQQKLTTQTQSAAETLRTALGWVEEAEAPSAEEPIQMLQPGALHVWVQVRQGDDWLDLDPVMTDAKPGSAALPASETLAVSDVSPETFHRVKVSAISERWVEEEREEHTLNTLTIRTADAVGEVLLFQTAPLTVNIDLGKALEAKEGQDPILNALLAETEWLPIFQFAGKTEFQSSVRADGTVNAKPSMTASGKAAENAADRISGLGKKAPAAGEGNGLTALWLEFESMGPGSAGRVERRMRFDLAGEDARRAGGRCPEITPIQASSRNLRIVGTSSIFVSGSEVSKAYLDFLAMDRLWNQRDMFMTLAKGEPLTLQLLESQKPNALDSAPEVLGLAKMRHKVSTARTTFLAEPNVWMHHSCPDVSDVSADTASDWVEESGMDVLWNEREPIWGQENEKLILLEQGVRDTAAEMVVLESVLAGSSADYESSLNLCTFEGDWTVVRTEADLGPLAGVWPGEALTRMTVHLQGGYVLVVPSAVDAGLPAWRVGYWRIDPSTGDTLGVGGQGWGAAVRQTSSEMIIMYAFVINVLVTIKGFAKCVMSAKTEADHTACGIGLLCNLVKNFIGLVVDNAIVGAVADGVCSFT